MLADTKIPLSRQTDLLEKANNNTQTIKAIMTGLLKIRVDNSLV